jgi:hypothetical protein
MTAASPAPTPDVQAMLNACTAPQQAGLTLLRDLIFARAARLPAIGPLTEALRWGQPAYLTLKTGAACSLRIGLPPNSHGPEGFALYVHCRTDLIETFLAGPGHGHHTIGSRAVLFRTPQDIAPHPLAMLIDSALTWHAPELRSPQFTFA